MKSNLDKSKQIHYISESDMIEFIDVNSDMEWNDICDFVRTSGITNDDGGGQIMWTKSTIFDKDAKKYFNSKQIHWIRGFFEAHNWMERIMIVFDD